MGSDSGVARIWCAEGHESQSEHRGLRENKGLQGWWHTKFIGIGDRKRGAFIPSSIKIGENIFRANVKLLFILHTYVFGHKCLAPTQVERSSSYAYDKVSIQHAKTCDKSMHVLCIMHV